MKPGRLKMNLTGTAKRPKETTMGMHLSPEEEAKIVHADTCRCPACRTPAPSVVSAKPVKAVVVLPDVATGPGWVEWTFPIRLDPTTNGGAFKKWLVGVAGKHRRAVANLLADSLRILADFHESIDAGAELRCTMTRLGGGTMDDDNLPPTMKYVRDTLALFLGVSDAPSGPISWKCRQEPGGPWGVRVRLEWPQYGEDRPCPTT